MKNFLFWREILYSTLLTVLCAVATQLMRNSENKAIKYPRNRNLPSYCNYFQYNFSKSQTLDAVIEFLASSDSDKVSIQ